MGGEIRYTRQFENDFNLFKSINKDYKLGCPNWAKDLFSLLNTTKNTDGSEEYLDVNEIENFFKLLKGNDSNNTDFVFDDAQFDTFKKTAGLSDDTPITKNQVESFLFSMTRNIYGRIDEATRNSDLYLDNDIENDLNKLESDIVFQTENKKFNKIVEVFDTIVKDGKISPKEANDLWDKITKKCTSKKDGNIVLDETKIKDFINKNLKNSDISVEDFVSFINTFEMAVKNCNSDNNLDYNNLHISQPNGKIDGVCKQNVGDCYLTSTLMAFSLSEEGREILNDCITKDDKGNVYVHLKGAKETYVVTPQELANYKYKTNSKNKSPLDGDGDLRAIEIAFAKHREKRNEYIESGDARIATFIITGIDCSNLRRTDAGNGKNYTREDLDEDYSNGYVITAVIPNLKGADPGDCYVIDEEGNEKKVKLIDNHSYVVSRIDDDNVYVYDTNDTDYGKDISKLEKRIPKDQFYKVFKGFNPIYLAEHQKIVHTPKNEQKYMTKIGNNTNITNTDYHSWQMHGFGDKQKQILSKFRQLRGSDTEYQDIAYNMAELKYFINAINTCLEDNKTKEFDEKCYKQLREILDINENDNISNDDLRDFYIAIMATVQ